MVIFESIDKGMELAWKVNIVAQKPQGDWQVMVNANNSRIIHVEDIAMYHIGSGMVYNPNPITSAQTVYGGNYVDNNDSNNAALQNERTPVMLMDITYENGVYKLEGPYCVLDDVELPSDNFPELTDPNGFNFTRDQQEFEAVMCYYHIDQASRRVEYLGYNYPALKTFSADPHGLGGDDDSYYSNSQNFVAFGEGGVDDAEDADVIWHEFAHAIQNKVTITGGMSNTGETLSVREGSSDYWAVSYSRSVSPYNWGYFANWSGHNVFWTGRRADLDLVFPDDYNFNPGYEHAGGQIWSSALMKIWGDLGRNITDKLFLKTHLAWGSSPDMLDAAECFIDADELLYNSSHYCTIVNHFRTHGLTNRITDLSDINKTISGDSEVCSSGTFFSIETPPPHVSITWDCSSNITRVSNQGANPCEFIANGFGPGTIEATLFSTVNSCIESVISPVKHVMVGAITPGISPTWSEACNCYVNDPLATNTTYDWDMITDNSSTSSTDYVWEVWGYELEMFAQQSEPTNGTRTTYPYTAYGKHLSYTFYDEQYYTIKAKQKMCGSWSSWANKYVTVGDGLLMVIAPNPTSGETTLSIKSSSEKTLIDESTVWEMEIYSPAQVLKEKNTKLKGNSTIIQTAGWKEGIYVVRVKYKDEILTGKLVVKK